MGLRGPQSKPEEEKGKTVAAYVTPELAQLIEEIRFTRERKASFIIAEAIKVGLPAIAAKYEAVRGLPENYNGEPLPK